MIKQDTGVEPGPKSSGLGPNHAKDPWIMPQCWVRVNTFFRDVKRFVTPFDSQLVRDMKWTPHTKIDDDDDVFQYGKKLEVGNLI